jgi:hypothetical protein
MEKSRNGSYSRKEILETSHTVCTFTQDAEALSFDASVFSSSSPTLPPLTSCLCCSGCCGGTATPVAILGHSGRFLGRDESGRGGGARGACGFVRGGVKRRDSMAAMAAVSGARAGKRSKGAREERKARGKERASQGRPYPRGSIGGSGHPDRRQRGGGIGRPWRCQAAACLRPA